MFTNRARVLVIGAFVIMLAVSINMHVYQILAVTMMFIGLLIYGYFKEGTIILAAKAFHHKDYVKTEALLDQIGTHSADELTRAIGTRVERIRNDFRGVVADTKFFFVDQRVIDAVNHQLA